MSLTAVSTTPYTHGKSTDKALGRCIMTAGRLYCIQSWNNASETSGEQIGNRLAQSRGLHFDRLGNANVALYAEENNEKKPTKVPLKNRILPQSARVDKLRSEAIELEAAFKAGEFSAEEYTLLRDVAFKKLRRAEELLKKAITPVQKEEETDEDSAQDGLEYTPCSGFSPQPNDGYASEEYEEIGVVWIDELSNENSLKNILKKACVVCRTLVRWHNRTKAYVQTLKEV